MLGSKKYTIFVLKLFLLAISWGEGGKLGQIGGEVQLLGGEASPVPPSLDETLIAMIPGPIQVIAIWNPAGAE